MLIVFARWTSKVIYNSHLKRCHPGIIAETQNLIAIQNNEQVFRCLHVNITFRLEFRDDLKPKIGRAHV